MLTVLRGRGTWVQLDGAAKTLVTLRVVVSGADLQLNSLVEIAMLLLTSLQKLPQRATDGRHLDLGHFDCRTLGSMGQGMGADSSSYTISNSTVGAAIEEVCHWGSPHTFAPETFEMDQAQRCAPDMAHGKPRAPRGAAGAADAPDAADGFGVAWATLLRPPRVTLLHQLRSATAVLLVEGRRGLSLPPPAVQHQRLRTCPCSYQSVHNSGSVTPHTRSCSHQPLHFSSRLRRPRPCPELAQPWRLQQPRWEGPRQTHARRPPAEGPGL